MREMPAECAISKEADYNICLACKDKCSYGKRMMEIFNRYQNDIWHRAERREINDVLEAR